MVHSLGKRRRQSTRTANLFQTAWTSLLGFENQASWSRAQVQCAEDERGSKFLSGFFDGKEFAYGGLQNPRFSLRRSLFLTNAYGAYGGKVENPKVELTAHTAQHAERFCLQYLTKPTRLLTANSSPPLARGFPARGF